MRRNPRLRSLATKPERMQRVQTRTRFREPSITTCTFCRFGRCRLLVLMFEWLTVLATFLVYRKLHTAQAWFLREGVPLAPTDAHRKH